jgi:putative oxidoreductase
MAYGLLLLRIVFGLTLAAHGAQKLFGSFGGPGLRGTAGFFGSLAFRGPPLLMAFAAGLGELGGGLLFTLGLATPFAALAMAVVMLNAIFSVTLKRAFMAGSELELAYLVTAVALAATGPGRFSLDRAIGWDDDITGLWWGVIVLAAAAVVSFATLTVLRTKPAPEPEPAPQT